MWVSDTVGRVRSRMSRAWRAWQQRRPSVAHAVTAYKHYQANHGDHLAAAITYFSFLALFPLILLAVSVLGFVLASNPTLQQDLLDAIYKNAPGALGTTLQHVVTTAINSRARVGVIGLIGVLLAGLGWIANLRTAIDTVWGARPVKRNFFMAKLADLVVLAGVGIGGVLSVCLTAAGTAAGSAMLRWLDLDGTPGAGTITAVLGVILGILGSMIIFGWLIIGLPDVKVSRRTALRTTLLAAIGFEILKIGGTYYIARITTSPAAAAIGSVVGALVWMDLVARYLTYCVAWAATAEPTAVQHPVAAASAAVAAATPPPTSPAEPPARQPTGPALSPVGVAAGLVSTGVAIGAASVAALQRTRRRSREPQR